MARIKTNEREEAINFRAETFDQRENRCCTSHIRFLIHKVIQFLHPYKYIYIFIFFFFNSIPVYFYDRNHMLRARVIA